MHLLQRPLIFIYMLLWLTQAVQAQQIQNVLDLSGVWTLRFEGIEANCQDETENGPRQGEFIFEVEQRGNILSATWKDGKTTNILTGKVSGSIVSITVYGFYPENCRVITDITAEVTPTGELIGMYTGQELNCETCTWEGEVTVTIAK